MQMERKRTGLFRTAPESSNTELQQTRVVHFFIREKHAQPARTFSAAGPTLQ